MADENKVIPVTRDKLFAIFKNQEIVKLIENLTRDVSIVIPEAIDGGQASASEALAKANTAIESANAAQESADQYSLERPDSDAVESLRRRVSDLECRLLLERRDEFDMLRREINELRSLVQGT